MSEPRTLSAGPEPVPLLALGQHFANLLVPIYRRVLRVSVVSAFLAVAVLVALAVPLAHVVGPIAATVILGLLSWCVFVAACAAIAFVPPLLVDGEDRAAWIALTWTGFREARRLFGSAHRAVDRPTNPRKAAAWLRRTPIADQPGEQRVELLLLVGRIEDAQATAVSLPETTPLEAFRKSLALATVAYQAGQAVDDVALATTADRVPPGLDRTWARAELACFQARRELPDGDWRGPLATVRREIPTSDLRILLAEDGMVMFAILLRKVVAPITPVFVGVVLTGGGLIWLASR